MGLWKASVWPVVKSVTTGGVIGLIISDRYLTYAPVRGDSMCPTFASSHTKFPGCLKGDRLLVEKLCLDKFNFARGDVVIFKAPSDHKKTHVKRIIGLPDDWVSLPESSDVVKVPQGHCWVEGDNSAASWDSRSYGPIPLGLIGGRATHIIWPPQRIGKVERNVQPGRVSPSQ